MEEHAMKNRKKVLVFILSLLLIFGIGALAACSATSDLPANDGAEGVVLSTGLTGADAAVFTDVPAGAWYAEAANWCQENGIMRGLSDTVFGPDDTLTRAMVATVLYRAAGEPAVSGDPAFGDTRAGTWYSNAIVWADGKGIVQGYGTGFFGTNDPVTLEQLDVMIRRYRGETPIWTGDPALAVPATHAQAAVAFYENLKAAEPAPDTAVQGTPVVYMTTHISPEGLMAIYQALGWTPEGKVAVKLSTGEPPASNYHNGYGMQGSGSKDEIRRDR